MNQVTQKSCQHDSTRQDGTLDDHCLRCGIEGYWHYGHRHDKPHPSGKILIDLECPDISVVTYRKTKDGWIGKEIRIE